MARRRSGAICGRCRRCQSPQGRRRANDERLAVASGKFECSGKRNNVLRLGCVVPVETGMWRRFLEVYGHNVGASIQRQRALKHLRGIVFASIKFDACIASPLHGRASAWPGGLQLCELAALTQCLNGGIDGFAEVSALWGVGDSEPLMSRNLHRNRELWSLAREP